MNNFIQNTWIKKKLKERKDIQDWNNSDIGQVFYENLKKGKKKILEEQAIVKNVLPF